MNLTLLSENKIRGTCEAIFKQLFIVNNLIKSEKQQSIIIIEKHKYGKLPKYV